MTTPHPAPSTPEPPAGKFPIWVGPRELLYGLMFIASGGIVGGVGNAVSKPELPADVKVSVDAARSAAEDVRTNLSEIKTTLEVMKTQASNDRDGVGNLRSRMDRAENQIQELQRKAPR